MRFAGRCSVFGYTLQQVAIRITTAEVQQFLVDVHVESIHTTHQDSRTRVFVSAEGVHVCAWAAHCPFVLLCLLQAESASSGSRSQRNSWGGGASSASVAAAAAAGVLRPRFRSAPTVDPFSTEGRLVAEQQALKRWQVGVLAVMWCPLRWCAARAWTAVLAT
jgi:hypothetical protein